MTGEELPGVTDLLHAAERGDATARERVFDLLYSELREIARQRSARGLPGSLLQPTALIHETYLRLFGEDPVHFEDRKHFLALASTAMRNVLVEEARQASAQKRGGGAPGVSLNELEEDPSAPQHGGDILWLDEALTKLARIDPEGVELIELRVFGGLTSAEVARLLKSSQRTVERRWQAAKAWLSSEREQSR